MISYKLQNKISQSYNVDLIKHSKSQESMVKKNMTTMLMIVMLVNDGDHDSHNNNCKISVKQQK